MIIIVEGLDNVGKGTQIAKIQQTMWPDSKFHIMHYSGIKSNKSPEQQKKENNAYYNDMFRILKSLHFKENINLILDRSHLGELVYAPMYRKYSGDHVLELEEKYSTDITFWDEIYLIVMYDNDVNNLIKRDDGLSFTTNKKKKEKEKNSFIEAFNKSKIKHKLLIDINDKNIDKVFEEISEFLPKE